METSNNLFFFILINFNLQRVESTPSPTGETHTKLPVLWLKDLSLVDTPGTNAIHRFHQQLTGFLLYIHFINYLEHFLPQADLVLWVISVDRAFSEVYIVSLFS